MQMQKQTTLAASISYSGNGLHSGKPVTMTLKPAAPDTGIVFIRTDLPDQPEIHAKAELVTSTLRATTISENGAQVFTVEHLLASLAMMHVDNCHIEMNSPEPPVADGSGLVFAQLVLKAGRKEQDAERKVYKVDRAFSVYDGDKYIVMLPYDGVRISFTSINPHPLLGTQYKDVELTEESFLKEIAPARTIGFTHRPRLLHITSNKQVDQARLAHAASPDKHRRCPLGHERAHGFDAFGHRFRHDERLHIRADKRPNALADALDLVLAFGEIGLREHDGHGGARFMSEHQFALQPAHIHFH